MENRSIFLLKKSVAIHTKRFSLTDCEIGGRWLVAVGGRRWLLVAVGGRRWPSVAVGEKNCLV